MQNRKAREFGARLNGITYQRWERSLKNGYVPKVATQMQIDLFAFCDYLDMNTDQILERQEQAISDPKPINRLWIQEQLLNYFADVLNAKGKISLNNRFKKAVFSFYSANGIELETGSLKNEFRKALKMDDTLREMPTKAELKQLFDHSDLTAKTQILVLRDSGLRDSDVAKITYGNVKQALTSEDGFGSFTVRQKKTGLVAHPIIGAEATKYLKVYLQGKNLKENDPIFTYSDGKVVTGNSISTDLYRRKEKLGLTKWTVHGIRAFFQTSLEMEGFPFNGIMRLMGKKITNSSGKYFKATDEELLAMYKEKYHVLAFELKPEFYKVEVKDETQKMLYELTDDMAKQIAYLTQQIQDIKNAKSEEQEKDSIRKEH